MTTPTEEESDDPVHRGGSAALRSASYQQKPDVAIEIEDDDGDLRVLIFDPKYKLDSEEVEGVVDGRPKKVDIDKMHAYRDAIRQHDHRVVAYAAILYPGPTAPSFGRGVDAISAVPGSAEPLDVSLRRVLNNELALANAQTVAT